MNINNVEIHPFNSSEVISLSFKDYTNSNPFNIREFTGLDAADIINQRYMGFNNSQVMDLALNGRQIVFMVDLNPSFMDEESFSSLRDQLYKIIWTSRQALVEVQFKFDDTVIAVTQGVISKYEAPIFAKSETVRISIDCMNPMLTSPVQINADVSSFNHSRFITYDRESTSPHGFTFRLHFLQNSDLFILKNVGDDASVFQVFSYGGFLSGDIMDFSSEFNNKKLTLTRGIEVMPIVDLITPGSIWPLMFPGENEFEVENPTHFHWDALSYYPTYWGI